MTVFVDRTWDGTGVCQTFKCRRCIVAVSGTFDATIKVKWIDDAGNHHTVQEDGADLEFTSAGERVLDFGVPVRVYTECTTYNSGSPRCSVTAAVPTREDG